MRCFTIEEPFYIFLVLPLIYSSLNPSNDYTLIANISALLLFDIHYLSKDKSYLDAWILLGFIIYWVGYLSRSKIAEYTSEDKIEFEAIEKYIFDRDFKSILTESEFRSLFNFSQMKKTRDGIDLAVAGKKIDKVVYMGLIPSYGSVIMKCDEVTICAMNEGDWGGVVEFILHISGCGGADNNFSLSDEEIDNNENKKENFKEKEKENENLKLNIKENKPNPNKEKRGSISYYAGLGHYYASPSRARKSNASCSKDNAIMELNNTTTNTNLVNKVDSNSNTKINWLVDLSILKNQSEVTYYEWDLVSMHNLFKYSSDNRFINKISLLWIKYLTYSIVKLQDRVSDSMKYICSPNNKTKRDLCKFLYLK